MPEDDVRYAVGDLATLGGVSRRTVRYYVQEGLIPAPLGLGRGNHYDPRHLQQLLRVKAMQEAGLTLDEIRVALDGGAGQAIRAGGTVADASSATAMPRHAVVHSLWRRLVVAPGVELHVHGTTVPPSPEALRELADWCQRHLGAAFRRREVEDHA